MTDTEGETLKEDAEDQGIQVSQFLFEKKGGGGFVEGPKGIAAYQL